MTDRLADIRVLALDCQAAGATPEYGDLLELGWAVCVPGVGVDHARSHWIRPRTNRRIPRAVRELTGWSEACIAEAVSEREAWSALRDDLARVTTPAADGRAPTVIHFARFELGFLRDLHERLGDGAEFPFDAVCVHAIASRLFPDLPRRNIRALAGYLGHAPELMRRSTGHVEATAFIWCALVPRLETLGLHTWRDLKAWLEEPSTKARRTRWVYPIAPERRRALPDRPGVYRFVRPNGDVVYVGKATSLKRRVASHFSSRARATERGLELLTQVSDIDYTETPSILEAALLECDEIKRLDPPYNVQFRSAERCAWFAGRNLDSTVPAPDSAHRIGPLPSQRALSPLRALLSLADGAARSAELRASAVAVPVAFVPDASLFEEAWTAFVAEHLSGAERSAATRIEHASRALWIARGRTELDASPEDSPPDFWDLARVRRHLERSLVQTGLLARRARWLCLLAGADVAFREPQMPCARVLVIASGAVTERRDLPGVTTVSELPARQPEPLDARRRLFDAAMYDRLRVLSTELRRIVDDGGEVAVHAGAHLLAGDRLARLMRAV